MIPTPRTAALDERLCKEWNACLASGGDKVAHYEQAWYEHKLNGYALETELAAFQWRADKPTVPGVYVVDYIKVKKAMEWDQLVEWIKIGDHFGWDPRQEAPRFLGPLPPTQEGGEG